MTIELTSAAVGVGAFIFLVVFVALAVSVIRLKRELAKGPYYTEIKDGKMHEIPINPLQLVREVEGLQAQVKRHEESQRGAASALTDMQKWRDYFRELWEQEERNTLMLCMVVLLIQGQKAQAEKE